MYKRTSCRKAKARRLFGSTKNSEVAEDVVALEVEVEQTLYDGLVAVMMRWSEDVALTVWLSVEQHLGLASASQAWLIGRSWSKLAVMFASVIDRDVESWRVLLTRSNWGAAGC
jgi:hypothetical protein